MVTSGRCRNRFRKHRRTDLYDSCFVGHAAWRPGAESSATGWAAAFSCRDRGSDLFANSGYRPTPIRFLAHRAGGLRLLTVDKNCLVHDAARLAAGIAEASHDLWAPLRGPVVHRSWGRMSSAIASLRVVTRGFARGLGVTRRLSAKGAGNVVLEEARDVDLEGFARIIEEISLRWGQRH